MSTTTTKTISHRFAGEEIAGASGRTSPSTTRPLARCRPRSRSPTPTRSIARCAPREPRSETRQDVSLTRRARLMFKFRELVDRYVDDLARIVSSEHGKVFFDAKRGDHPVQLPR